MKLGLSCGFTHKPEDGAFIPASVIVPGDRKTGGPWAGKVMPIVGYTCAYDGQRFYWGFVKFESPWVWPKGSPQEARSHGGEIASCRCAEYSCNDCHKRTAFIWRGGRDKKASCPFCGSTNCDVEPIKDGGPQYLRMVDPLRTDLMALAKSAYDDDAALPFAFPVVVAGGPGVECDPALPPSALGIAQAKGRGLKALANMLSIDELRIKNGDISILPEPTSGFADYEQVREGISWESGCMRFYLKPWLPEPHVGPTVFEVFRY